MKSADYDRVTRHVRTQIPAEPVKGKITRKRITGDRMKMPHMWLGTCDDLLRDQYKNRS